MSATSIVTRIRVDDFDTWKPMFDRDQPRARESATGYSLYRGLDDPNEVFIRVDFACATEAVAARQRLLDSGVLERFPDRSGPTVVEQVVAREGGLS